MIKIITPDHIIPDDVAFSLLPLDVGFDLREQGMIVVIPSWFAPEETQVFFQDEDGIRYMTTGSVIEIEKALRDAGFKTQREEVEQ